jgi:hypothetical protein
VNTATRAITRSPPRREAEGGAFAVGELLSEGARREPARGPRAHTHAESTRVLDERARREPTRPRAQDELVAAGPDRDRELAIDEDVRGVLEELVDPFQLRGHRLECAERAICAEPSSPRPRS